MGESSFRIAARVNKWPLVPQTTLHGWPLFSSRRTLFLLGLAFPPPALACLLWVPPQAVGPVRPTPPCASCGSVSGGVGIEKNMFPEPRMRSQGTGKASRQSMLNSVICRQKDKLDVAVETMGKCTWPEFPMQK